MGDSETDYEADIFCLEYGTRSRYTCAALEHELPKIASALERFAVTRAGDGCVEEILSKHTRIRAVSQLGRLKSVYHNPTRPQHSSTPWVKRYSSCDKLRGQ